MKLLVDLGNSRLKWAALRDGRLAQGGVFAHAGLPIAHALARYWGALSAPEAVYAASVAGDEVEAILAECVRERFGLEVRFVRSPAAALGVGNAYAEPAQLGVDRFLALAALHHATASMQVFASCGTALTLDALDADGRHLGGLIAPAPALMRRALDGGTARVRDLPGRLVERADNTADGAWSGCSLAAVALIERFRAGVSRELGVTASLHVDGGGIDELLPLLPDAKRERNLVLRGLALWAADAG